jgi:hypothetical protein
MFIAGQHDGRYGVKVTKSVEEEEDDQMVWTGLHLAVRCESQ